MTASIGVPVGAILVYPRDLQPLRIYLQEKFGKFKFRGVEKRKDGRLLVHLPPTLAGALDREELTIPHGTYLPGVRKSIELPQNPATYHSEFTFVELFAGIGGFRLGLEELGGKCVLAVEQCSKATNIYKSYFTNDHGILVEANVLDLNLRDFPPYTMLTAGFPCQPFSNRGHQQGLEDDEGRGQLYLELVRILTETQPPCFLFENVSQLVLMDGGSRDKRIKNQVGTFRPGRVLEQMLTAFSKCGYTVNWKIINSRHFVPQNRERVYIVGTRQDLQCPPLDWDEVLPTNPCTKTVRDVLEPNEGPAVQQAELSLSQWNKVLSLRDENCVYMNLDKKAPTLISQYRRVGSFSSKFIPTEGRGGRFLTRLECSRIMGFPEDYPCDDTHFYVGIGNAVTPPVVQAIGRELLHCLAESSNKLA